MNTSETYYALIAKRQRIAAEIEQRRVAAIEQIRSLMAEFDITVSDITGRPAYRSSLPAKYRDAAGNSWTGVGRPPVWVRRIREAGLDLEAYRVTE